LNVERLDHIHIYVKDHAKAVKRFEELLGVKFEILTEEVGQLGMGVKDAYSTIGIDILQALYPEHPIAKATERSGEGLVGGVSFKVPDIEAGIAHLQSKGMRLLGRIEMGGIKEAWFHPKDAHNVLIELCEYNAENALEASRQKKI